jgi:hypothetical protein
MNQSQDLCTNMCYIISSDKVFKMECHEDKPMYVKGIAN